jgi:hypothetical protein
MAKKSPAKRIIFPVAILGPMAILGYYALNYTSANAAAGIKPLNESVLQARFAYLSGVHTNPCAIPAFIYGLQNDSYLQGSCCSPMNFTSYVEQVNGLRNYSGIFQIPADPYNISTSLAKELLGYQNMTLTSAQQATFDNAMNMSSPCCCHCWRWYAFAGQAKYLIVNYNFSASRIAAIWGLEDGCGGPLDSQGFNPPAT